MERREGKGERAQGAVRQGQHGALEADEECPQTMPLRTRREAVIVAV